MRYPRGYDILKGVEYVTPPSSLIYNTNFKKFNRSQLALLGEETWMGTPQLILLGLEQYQDEQPSEIFQAGVLQYSILQISYPNTLRTPSWFFVQHINSIIPSKTMVPRSLPMPKTSRVCYFSMFIRSIYDIIRKPYKVFYLTTHIF